jgi:DNA-binding CsgD family transcriptional regulator
VGYTYRLPDILLSLGYVCLLEGDYERGAALNEEAAALCREHGYRGHLNVVLDNLGWAALLQGDRDRARTYYEESLVVSKELGDRACASESLDGMACIAGATGEATRAGRLFGTAEAMRETWIEKAVAFKHSPEEEGWREPYRATARSRLGEASWEEALTQGRAMRMDEAIDYALSEEETSAPTPSTTGQSSHPSMPEQPAGLTPREVEVLGLVARGMTSAQIAKELFVSTRTIEAHVASIYHKLGVSSRSAATRFALEHDLA